MLTYWLVKLNVIFLAGPIWYRRIQKILQEGVWEQDLQNLQADCLNCDVYIVWQSTVRKSKSKSALHHLYFITHIFHRCWVFISLNCACDTQILSWNINPDCRSKASCFPMIPISPLNGCVVVSQKSPVILRDKKCVWLSFQHKQWTTMINFDIPRCDEL